jgi:hypothetical protein
MRYYTCQSMTPDLQRSRAVPTWRPINLSGRQDDESRAGSSANTTQTTSSVPDQAPKSLSSHLLSSRYKEYTRYSLNIHDNGCHDDSQTTRWHAMFPHATHMNAEHESAVGFSRVYEPLLRGLLSSNINKVRLGSTILRS